MTVKNMVPRCVSTCRDGSQCGRRVTDGSTPPVCHIHAKRSTSPLTQPVERTPLEIIQKLMSDRDPAIRLRAANTYLDKPYRDNVIDFVHLVLGAHGFEPPERERLARLVNKGTLRNVPSCQAWFSTCGLLGSTPRW